MAAVARTGKRKRRALGLTRRFLGSLLARRCSLGGQPARQAHDSPLTRRVRVLGVSCNWGCGFSIATSATPQYAAPAVPLDWSSWGTAQKRWRAPRGQTGALSAFLCPSLCDRGRPVGCSAPTLRGPRRCVFWRVPIGSWGVWRASGGGVWSDGCRGNWTGVLLDWRLWGGLAWFRIARGGFPRREPSDRAPSWGQGPGQGPGAKVGPRSAQGDAKPENPSGSGRWDAPLSGRFALRRECGRCRRVYRSLSSPCGATASSCASFDLVLEFANAFWIFIHGGHGWPCRRGTVVRCRPNDMACRHGVCRACPCVRNRSGSSCLGCRKR
jgi:hypothetical protein